VRQYDMRLSQGWIRIFSKVCVFHVFRAFHAAQQSPPLEVETMPGVRCRRVTRPIGAHPMQPSRASVQRVCIAHVDGIGGEETASRHDPSCVLLPCFGCPWRTCVGWTLMPAEQLSTVGGSLQWGLVIARWAIMCRAWRSCRRQHVLQLVELQRNCLKCCEPSGAVGIYVPGGTAILPSSALMLSVPAGLAGCGTIVLATPPRSDGSISPEASSSQTYNGLNMTRF